MTISKCAAAPCKSCPYRCDVPSGLWDVSEYEKLPDYDGTILEQLTSKGGAKLFDCHQKDGNLCAGWLATHGTDNLAALRIHGDKIDDSIWGYRSPVPVFASGAEAAEHGMREIKKPNARARRMIDRMVRKL